MDREEFEELKWWSGGRVKVLTNNRSIYFRGWVEEGRRMKRWKEIYGIKGIVSYHVVGDKPDYEDSNKTITKINFLEVVFRGLQLLSCILNCLSALENMIQ